MLIFSDEGTTPRAHLQLGMEHMMSSRLEVNRHEDSPGLGSPTPRGWYRFRYNTLDVLFAKIWVPALSA